MHLVSLCFIIFFLVSGVLLEQTENVDPIVHDSSVESDEVLSSDDVPIANKKIEDTSSSILQILLDIIPFDAYAAKIMSQIQNSTQTDTNASTKNNETSKPTQATEPPNHHLPPDPDIIFGIPDTSIPTALEAPSSTLDPHTLSTLSQLSNVRDKFNYASMDCGANVLSVNREAKDATSILVGSKDRYMLNPCGVSKRFVVLELCEEIGIQIFAIANYEFFSSMLKDFQVFGTNRYPPAQPHQWTPVGNFTAQNVRRLQYFVLPEPMWFKYIRIQFDTYYGDEYYCPISELRIHGTTVVDDITLQIERDSREISELANALRSPFRVYQPPVPPQPDLKAISSYHPPIHRHAPEQEDDDEDDPIDHNKDWDSFLSDTGNLLKGLEDTFKQSFQRFRDGIEENFKTLDQEVSDEEYVCTCDPEDENCECSISYETAEIKPEIKPQNTPEIAENKPETKPEITPETIKPETIPETKPETKPEIIEPTHDVEPEITEPKPTTTDTHRIDPTQQPDLPPTPPHEPTDPHHPPHTAQHEPTDETANLDGYNDNPETPPEETRPEEKTPEEKTPEEKTLEEKTPDLPEVLPSDEPQIELAGTPSDIISIYPQPNTEIDTQPSSNPSEHLSEEDSKTANGGAKIGDAVPTPSESPHGNADPSSEYPQAFIGPLQEVRDLDEGIEHLDNQTLVSLSEHSTPRIKTTQPKLAENPTVPHEKHTTEPKKTDTEPTKTDREPTKTDIEPTKTSGVFPEHCTNINNQQSPVELRDDICYINVTALTTQQNPHPCKIEQSPHPSPTPSTESPPPPTASPLDTTLQNNNVPKNDTNSGNDGGSKNAKNDGDAKNDGGSQQDDNLPPVSQISPRKRARSPTESYESYSKPGSTLATPQNIFKSLINRIKTLEINQSIAAVYLADLTAFYSEAFSKMSHMFARLETANSNLLDLVHNSTRKLSAKQKHLAEEVEELRTERTHMQANISVLAREIQILSEATILLKTQQETQQWINICAAGAVGALLVFIIWRNNGNTNNYTNFANNNFTNHDNITTNNTNGFTKQKPKTSPVLKLSRSMGNGINLLHPEFEKTLTPKRKRRHSIGHSLSPSLRTRKLTQKEESHSDSNSDWEMDADDEISSKYFKNEDHEGEENEPKQSESKVRGITDRVLPYLMRKSASTTTIDTEYRPDLLRFLFM